MSLSLFILPLLLSCSQSKNGSDNSQGNYLGKYDSMTFMIDPETDSEGMSLNQYSVDSVCSLVLPDGINDIVNSKFVVDNGYIYIMDSKINNTIFTFDYSGHFISKSGARGRAKDEFIGYPTDFFVNDQKDIYAFDRDGQKVLIFNKGTFIDKIANKYVSHSFGMTSTGNFMFCINNMPMSESDSDPSFVIYNHNLENEKVFIPSKKYPYIYCPHEQTFFSNGKRISHIPLLADSVLVFKEDNLEKIVRFNFNCGFLIDEYPDFVQHKPNEDPREKMKKVNEYKGVHALCSYQETDGFILLEYDYQSSIKRWLYNKKTKQAISGLGLFDGACPFTKYYLKGNQIIAYVSPESIDAMRKYYNGGEGNMKDFKKSSTQVKGLFEGKIATPALFYITIK